MRLAIAGAIATLSLISGLCYADAEADMTSCMLSMEAKPSALSSDDTKVSPTAAKRFSEHPLGAVYFHYFRKVGDGTMQDVINNLRAMHDAGIETVVIQALNSQSADIMNPGTPHETKNDHGYWPKALDIDPKLGSWDKLRELTDKAHALGMRVLVDMVFDHFGYGDFADLSHETEDGTTVTKIVSTKDKDFFRLNYNQERLEELFELYNRETDPVKSFEILRELSTLQWDPNLPVNNHDNAFIAEAYYQYYRKMIDHGIDGGRLDAFKHIPLAFQLRLVNRLGDYANAKYSKQLAFVAEHLVSRPRAREGEDYTPEKPYNYVPLDTVAKYFHKHSRYPIFFIDFPLADQIRDLALKLPYSFADLRAFIEDREHLDSALLLERMLPDLENHDFLSLLTDPRNRYIVNAISDFFGPMPTMIYHGGENLVRPNKGSRDHVPAINGKGDIARMKVALNKVLGPMRQSPDFFKTTWHAADYHTLAAEKKDGDTSAILVVQRGDGIRSLDIPSDEKILGVEVVFDSSEANQADDRQRDFSYKVSKAGEHSAVVNEVGDHHMRITFDADGKTMHIATYNDVVVLLKVTKEKVASTPQVTSQTPETQEAVPTN